MFFLVDNQDDEDGDDDGDDGDDDDDDDDEDGDDYDADDDILDCRTPRWVPLLDFELNVTQNASDLVVKCLGDLT